VFSWSIFALAFGLAVSLPANAGMVTTDDVASAAVAGQAREHVKTLVQRPELAAELTLMGVAPDQVQARVDAMTDQEVIAMSGKLDSLVAAGALSNNDLILILVIVLLVVLIA
jgi:hypothetical protein